MSSSSTVIRAAGSIEALSDVYLTVVKKIRSVTVPTFMAEARERLQHKETNGQQLSSWEQANEDRIRQTDPDETSPAVVLAALVAETRADFNSSVVTTYTELVFAGQGVVDAFADTPDGGFRVGRFSRRHNGRYAPWDFLDAHSQDADELLTYAREVI